MSLWDNLFPFFTNDLPDEVIVAGAMRNYLVPVNPKGGKTMSRYFDQLDLQDRARALRNEALAGMARAAAIKWRTLVAHLAENAPAAPTRHVPLPCQGPAPTHP